MMISGSGGFAGIPLGFWQGILLASHPHPHPPRTPFLLQHSRQTVI